MAVFDNLATKGRADGEKPSGLNILDIIEQVSYRGRGHHHVEESPLEVSPYREEIYKKPPVPNNVLPCTWIDDSAARSQCWRDHDI